MPGSVFDQVVCGIDASGESLEAARQAARLVADDGKLTLVGIADLARAGLALTGAGALAESLADEARDALERARSEVESVHEVETSMLMGLPPRDLPGEADRLGATLLVVGTHERSRPLGALLGSVGSTVVHDKGRSVLVARGSVDPSAFPASIVCGVDGSEGAQVAIGVASQLAERFGASVDFVAADDRGQVDFGRASESVTGSASLRTARGKAVEVLLEACASADLLVVGCRGLGGVRAVGSVSERVAHEAPCSVLVARDTP